MEDRISAGLLQRRENSCTIIENHTFGSSTIINLSPWAVVLIGAGSHSSLYSRSNTLNQTDLFAEQMSAVSTHVNNEDVMS